MFAAVSAGIAFVTSAQPAASAGQPPVTINSCGPIIDKNQQQNVFGVSVPVSTSNGMAIEFVNESKQVATLVNFEVASAGEHFVIRDVGKFSPGVSINHKYRNGQGQSFVLPAFIAPNVKCHVASVEFADGTVWRRNQTNGTTTQGTVNAPGQTATPLAATPTSLSLESATTSALFLVSSSSRVAAFKETDNCAKIAEIFVSALGDSSATYSVRPVAAGTCSARITDDDGNAITVPITVK
ncbi:MAG: hypothetical protein JO219_05665 [Candidatus Eremiobacteraeota bacterium]|nr:hypothetical protein [Candidatus Eremiobacteraeota bacterium]